MDDKTLDQYCSQAVNPFYSEEGRLRALEQLQGQRLEAYHYASLQSMVEKPPFWNLPGWLQYRSMRVTNQILNKTQEVLNSQD